MVLTDEQVANGGLSYLGDSRRHALLRRLAIGLGEDGYRGVSVAEACRDAGVEPAELGAELGDKDQLLRAAFDYHAGQLVQSARDACAIEAPWPQRVRAGLASLCPRLAHDPQVARAIARSFPAIGPSSYLGYGRLLDRFVPFMREGRRCSPVGEELPGEVELLAVGSAESIIFGEIEAGRAKELPALVPEILFALLVPFLGPEAAAAEMRAAAA